MAVLYKEGLTYFWSKLKTLLNGKQNNITGGATTITTSNLTTNRALISNGNGKVAVSPITNTELNYLDGVTSNIQTQLNGLNNNKSPVGHNHNDLYYQKSDFLRVKTITLGYTLPEKWVRKATLSKCRIYLTAENPFIFTNYEGIDPEGATGYAYPSVSSWIVGVNLSF